MRKRSDGDDLLDLAAAISDGTPINWGKESESRPRIIGMIDRLRRLEAVVAAHRAVMPTLPSDTPREVAGSLSVPGEHLTTWGPLRILEPLGRGGFGKVYRAYDPSLQREVALKLLHLHAGGDAAEGRYLSEARRMARVRHRNVVAVLGADRHDGRVGLWTELVRGRTLEELLAEQGPLGPEEAAVIGMDLCRALAAVHAGGLVHRDVKTTNVMREQGGRIVLMDFGAVGELVVEQGRVVPGDLLEGGTLLTMAPEQLRGADVGPGADIYGLGVLLYRLVTGRFPVEGSNASDLLPKKERGEWTPLRDLRPDLPAEFVRIVERALHPQPEQRFPSPGAMEQALAECLGTVNAGIVPRTLPSRRWRSAGLMVAAVMVLVVGGALTIWRFQRKELSARQPAAPSTSALPGPTAGSAHSQGPVTGRAQSVGEVAGGRPDLQSAATPASPLTATVSFYRVRGGREEVLAPGDRVAVGDGLYLNIEGSDSMTVYVLNEDANGGPFVLFPLPVLDETNPLAAHVSHRLPGRLGEKVFNWQVTSPGGREDFVVIASREPLPTLEHEIAPFVHANPGQAVAYQRISHRAVGRLRAAIGLVEQPSSASDGSVRLIDIVRRLSEKAREPGERVHPGFRASPHAPWIWWITLENPQP